MASIGKWTGSAASVYPTTSWTAPNSLITTEARNDASAFGWAAATSTLTLPSTITANGYLIVAAYELESSHNNRAQPQGQIVQASGTGTFVAGATGGYSRDDSEDRAYIRCWAFVDSPSASATFQFQWRRDVGTGTNAGASVRSEIEVIPLSYSDSGLYSSNSTAATGGITPSVVAGWSGTNGTNIQLASNAVSLTGDNKRYLILGSQYFDSFASNRTQRWHGLDIDGVQERAAQAYTFYRDTSNAQSGDMFTWLVATSTATVTVEQTVYRGDGVANGQGGADSDAGTTAAAGDHALVILELNDSAEVFRSKSSTNSSDLSASPTDININEVTDFSDSASFTDLVNTSINVASTADYLFGANISTASNNVGATQRWTGFAEMHINGVEDSSTFGGDYLRNNQGTQDTFGWSANLLGYQGLTAGDDVGISVTELVGTENGGNTISPAGWSGFWGVNLDTLEGGATATHTLSGTVSSGSSSSSGNVSNFVVQTLSGSITAAQSNISGNVSNTVVNNLNGTIQASQANTSGLVSNAKTLSGTIQAQAANVFGDRVIQASAATVTGNILVDSGSISLNGTVAAQTASVSGAIENSIVLSGSIASDSPVVSGNVSIDSGVTHTLSGTVTAAASSVVGDRIIQASNAGVSGSILVDSGSITLSGSVVSDGSNVSGQVDLVVQISGTIQAQDSTLTGAIERVVILDGSVSSDSADVSGFISNAVALSGLVASSDAGISGSVSNSIVLDGSIQAGDSGVTGLITRLLDYQGAIDSQSATVTGAIGNVRAHNLAPSKRVIITQAENRAVGVDSESRQAITSQQTRTVITVSENRALMTQTTKRIV